VKRARSIERSAHISNHPRPHSFREADCSAAYERNASGTMRTMKYISCMQAHAEQRIKELEEYERE
jgi:uncharacterized protein YecT (DUF1311 family)